ncbi:MAG: diaminopimelate epimerase [Actinomycetia bacterium]|nr:diaminopimelate epimerase [Actinomycetes bacterium]
MDFVKVQGLSNDFIVIDGPYVPDPLDVVRWCERRTGVGADGVLVIEPIDSGRMSMRYWNADGGEAEMCGNGLRCIARLGYDREWVTSRTFVVETAVGDHEVTVHEDFVRAFVGVANPFRTETLSIAGYRVHPFAIGNPHAVIFVDDVDEAPVDTVGPEIEHDAMFPNRTNVEFVQVMDDGSITARIWERGVGETPASGTGATASAYVAHTFGGLTIPIVVHLRGGALIITFDDRGAWMEGPAEIVFSGTLD